MGELVEDVLDLHPRGGGAMDRRQQDTAVGDTYRERDAGLERLDDDLAVDRLGGVPVVTSGELQLLHADLRDRLGGRNPKARQYTKDRGAGLCAVGCRAFAGPCGAAE